MKKFYWRGWKNELFKDGLTGQFDYINFSLLIFCFIGFVWMTVLILLDKS